jgi:hypothetical protein
MGFFPACTYYLPRVRRRLRIREGVAAEKSAKTREPVDLAGLL